MKNRRIMLWGRGGYYEVERYPDGGLAVPAGRAAWERFVKYAPDEDLELAIAALERMGMARGRRGRRRGA